MQLSLKSSTGSLLEFKSQREIQMEVDNSMQPSAGIFLSNVSGSNWNHT